MSELSSSQHDEPVALKQSLLSQGLAQAVSQVVSALVMVQVQVEVEVEVQVEEPAAMMFHLRQLLRWRQWALRRLLLLRLPFPRLRLLCPPLPYLQFHLKNLCLQPHQPTQSSFRLTVRMSRRMFH
jgi:hypothetical protein